jgi:hypothetical protein
MDQPRFHVRAFRPGDEAGILALFNRVFAEGDPDFQPRTVEAWRWEFEQNPCGIQILVACDEDGRIIAHYAGLPAVYHIAGREQVAGQGVDSMVHPDYRRGLRKEGPFLAVARRYFATYGTHPVNPFTFGYPNRRAIRVGQRLLGYVPVVDRLPTLYRNFFEHDDDDEVGRGLAGQVEVREVETFSPEVNGLWAELRDAYPFAVVRDHRYVTWRYCKAPHLPYRRFEIRDADRLRAWFVTRAGWQQKPILALTDFFAAPDDDLALGLALHRAVRVAREAEQVRVEAWFPEQSRPFRTALERGFSREECLYVLCIRIHDPALELDWIRKHWYYTIGDSDLF